MCLVAQFYVSLFPIGKPTTAKGFFENYLAAPVAIAFFVGYKIWSKNWSIGTDLRKIDIDEGRREVDFIDFREDLDEERRVKATWPWWKRWWDKWM